jgi:hypothetical protein
MASTKLYTKLCGRDGYDYEGVKNWIYKLNDKTALVGDPRRRGLIVLPNARACERCHSVVLRALLFDGILIMRACRSR